MPVHKINRPGLTLLVAASDALDKVMGNADYVCDGTADDVQIQAAIDALAGGGTVQLSEGTFSISSIIDLEDDVSLIGVGSSTIIFMANASDLATALRAEAVSGIKIADLIVDSNGANQDAAALARNVYIDQCTEITISNCTLVNARSHSVDIVGVGTLSHDILITDCTISGFDIDDSSNDGISVGDDQYNVRINACHIYNSGPGSSARSGVEIEDGAHDVTVLGCVIHDVTTGVELHVHTGEPAIYGVTAQGCVITDCQYGARIQGIDAAYAYAVSFSENIIHGCEIGYGLNRCQAVINGNVVFGNTTYGISLYKVSYSIISNNWVYGNTTHGISLNQGIYCIVSNCQVFSNTQRGIALTDSTRCIISNNQVADNDSGDTNNYSGLWLNGGSHYNTARGNHFYVTAAGTYQKYGVEVLAGATGNIISGNRMDQAGRTGNLSNAGTGTVIRDNYGYITENSGTGSIASGTTSVVVAHGLSVTPTVDDIMVTLAENPTNTPGAIWVDTIGAANFTVNCENDPGASNLDFGWRAQVL